jgi:hypothetical protein
MASIDPAKFDWANDEILQSAAASVTATGLTAPFFATHDSPFLKNLANGQFEIGLHPNFNRRADVRSPLTELLELYPAVVAAGASRLGGNDAAFFRPAWATDLDIYRQRLNAVDFRAFNRVLDAECGVSQWTTCLAHIAAAQLLPQCLSGHGMCL